MTLALQVIRLQPPGPTSIQRALFDRRLRAACWAPLNLWVPGPSRHGRAGAPSHFLALAFEVARRASNSLCATATIAARRGRSAESGAQREFDGAEFFIRGAWHAGGSR